MVSKDGEDDDRYAFLDPWFACLRGRIAVDDPQRVDTEGALAFGRDPETDWWLRVYWWLAKGTTPADRVSRVRRIREALLLVGVLARVDNAAWVRKLCGISRFAVPPFMDLAVHELHAHFVVVMSEFATPETDDVTCWLMADLSDDFTRDYTRLVTLYQASFNRDADASASILPRLRFQFVCIGEAFLTTVKGMLVSYLENTSEDQEPSRPTCVLDALELNALTLLREPSGLDALRRVIELGVPI